MAIPKQRIAGTCARWSKFARISPWRHGSPVCFRFGWSRSRFSPESGCVGRRSPAQRRSACVRRPVAVARAVRPLRPNRPRSLDRPLHRGQAQTRRGGRRRGMRRRGMRSHGMRPRGLRGSPRRRLPRRGLPRPKARRLRGAPRVVSWSCSVRSLGCRGWPRRPKSIRRPRTRRSTRAVPPAAAVRSRSSSTVISPTGATPHGC